MIEIKGIKNNNFNFDIKGDSLLDMEFIDNDLEIFKQSLEILINTIQGKWAYESKQGINYNYLFNNKQIPLNKIEHLYRSEIEKLTGFKSMSNFSVDLTTNDEIKISFNVQSVYSPVSEFININLQSKNKKI